MTAAFVLDANVLYSARLRDLWLQLGILQVARIVLTRAIEKEWVDAVARQRPELISSIARTVALMRDRMPDAYLSDDERAPIAIELPDPNDTHVVQAAIAAGAAIVTFNLADFPVAAIGEFNVDVLSPDDALLTVGAADEEVSSKPPGESGHD